MANEMEKGFKEIKESETRDIHMRDPFVYVDNEEKKYYLFGTTFADGCGDIDPHFEVYVGRDLLRWEGPYIAFKPPRGFWGVRHYWAPEVFKYKDNRYYMFATFKGGIGENRGTSILVADNPWGPYFPHSIGPVTLKDHECLDGTFHIDEDGNPWIVFCHEWTELYDGRINALPLTEDLKMAKCNRAVEILKATEMKWIRHFEDQRICKKGYLTDGPFLYTTQNKSLLMLWSSYSIKCYSKNGLGGYTVAIARSENGRICGPWTNDSKLLLDNNAGHPSIFRDFQGQLRLTVHSPDAPHGKERPNFIKIKEVDDNLIVEDRNCIVHE